MNVSGNDVKVLGKVVSIAVDNIVADAEQVFDKNSNLNQETVNKNLSDAIQDAVIDIAALESSKQDVLTFDNVPTANSNNPVKSGGVDAAINNVIHALNVAIAQETVRAEAAFYTLDLQNATGSAAQATELHIVLNKNDGSEEDPDIHTIGTLTISQATENKAGLLPAKSEWDDEPTAGSNNLVTSGGIKSAIDNIISYDSTYNRKTLESTYVEMVGRPCLYLSAGGEWPEGAGEISLHSTEGTIELTGDSYVHIRSGKQQYTTSPIVGGNINIETGGHIYINGDPVKINGKDISSAINNIFPSGSYTGNDLTTTPGLYLYEAGVDRNHFTPAIDEYTTGLLIVTHEHGIDDSTGDGWNNVCQLFIDMYGNRYSRRLPYTNRVQDIDWTNAPDFTLTS